MKPMDVLRGKFNTNLVQLIASHHFLAVLFLNQIYYNRQKRKAQGVRGGGGGGRFDVALKSIIGKPRSIDRKKDDFMIKFLRKLSKYLRHAPRKKNPFYSTPNRSYTIRH